MSSPNRKFLDSARRIKITNKTNYSGVQRDTKSKNYLVIPKKQSSLSRNSQNSQDFPAAFASLTWDKRDKEAG
jgi:hypothetical protein